MESFINKIFNSRIDELVHLQFQKFSRGTFTQRALIKASNTGKGYSLSTGNEFANDFVRAMAEKLGSSESHVTGAVVSTSDLKGKLPSTGLKQFMGIKQYVINGKMTGNDIIKLLDSFPEAFFALSFSVGENVLKIKPKAPKSAKPKTSEGPPKIDFCSLKTHDAKLIEQFVFEKNWKKIEIEHTFIISDIELPQGVTEPTQLRKLAKRKGTIVRKAKIDEKETVSEKTFSA
jgi:hypothetical protein